MTRSAYAAQSDPALNPQFRRWVDPPDPLQKRERRPGEGRRLKSSDGINDRRASTPNRPALQAAMCLDRAADFLLSLGRHRAAERLAHAAVALRGAA